MHKNLPFSQQIVSNPALLIFVLFLSYISPQLFANDKHLIEIDDQFQHRALSDHLLYLSDYNNSETIQSIVKSLNGRQTNWQHLKAGSISSFDMRQHWFAFRIKNINQKSIKLIINYDYAWLWDFNLYMVNDATIIDQIYTMGHKHPFNERPISKRTFNMPLSLESDSEYWILIKAQGRVMQIYNYLNLYQETAFHHDFEKRERMIWFYYGVMLVMVLYNLVLFFSIKEPVYLSFSLFVASILAVYFSTLGHGYELLWPTNPWFNERSTTWFALLTIITNVQFYVRFLDVKTCFPVFYKLCQILQLIACILIVDVFFIPPREQMNIIAILYIIIGLYFLLSFASSIYLQFAKKSRVAKHYNLAFGVLCIMVTLFVLKDGGYIETSIISLYGVFLGQMLMVVILSLVLADQINVLKNEQQLAKAQSNAKSAILARMSHEIRTPMNGVLGMSELLSTTQLDERQNAYNKQIYTSGSTLLSIINDILDFSKIEAGKMTLDKYRFDLQVIVSETMGMFRLTAAEKGIELILHYDQQLARNFSGDPIRIQQILINYLNNALKFTEEGEVTVNVVTAGNNRVRLEVVDTGIGIDKENQSELFQAFNQADSHITRNYGGTGLGLAICKQIAELMHGEAGVESEIGKGSTFFVELELKAEPEPEDKHSLEPNDQHSPEPNDYLIGKRILIVDDNHVYAQLSAKQAQHWGMEANLAFDAEKALNSLREAGDRQAHYDLVVIDQTMPERDGISLANEINNDKTLQHILILLLCPAFDKPDAEILSKNGISYAIEKPLQVESLCQAYNEILASKHWQEKKLGNEKTFQENSITQKGKRLNVLVAEDNAVNQRVLGGMLKHLGANFTITEDGPETIKAYNDSLTSAEKTFHFILMDCEMPTMDGLEASREIRLMEKRIGSARIPIYALTANAVQDYFERCIDAGMDDFITKPVTINTLRAIILGSSVDDQFNP